MAADGIVNTLKAKIKANGEELERYETECRETREKLESESKSREEAELEVLNLERKIKLLESQIETKNDAVEETERKLQNTSDHLQSSDEHRQNIETKYTSTEDKIEILEQQVLEAKKIAEESDQKCEEIVRKLVLTEQQKDRAEERAARNDSKIVGLQTEVSDLNKTVASLSGSEEKSALRGDDIETQVKELKDRLMDAECRAETAERAVQKLQKEVDVKEGEMMTEKGKSRKMEEDMESLMTSIASI